MSACPATGKESIILSAGWSLRRFALRQILFDIYCCDVLKCHSRKITLNDFKNAGIESNGFIFAVIPFHFQRKPSFLNEGNEIISVLFWCFHRHRLFFRFLFASNSLPIEQPASPLPCVLSFDLHPLVVSKFLSF